MCELLVCIVPVRPLLSSIADVVPRERLAARGLLIYLAINELGFRRVLRIKQIEEGVIHRGRRSRWITPYENSLIASLFVQNNP